MYAVVTFTCDGEYWVANVEVIEEWTYGVWLRTGNSRVCYVAGHPGTPGEYSLSAGHYELAWGAERIFFEVPAESQVRLAWREEGGVYVAVLSMQSGAELIVDADALADDVPAQLTGFAETTEPTLSAVAASLRDPTATEPERSVTRTECAVAEVSEDGAAQVSLDSEPCAIVRDGGAVIVAQRGESLELTLAVERDWLIINGTVGEEAGTTAVRIVDLLTGGYLTFALADGTELARHVPQDQPELAALFDAIAASAQ